MEGVVPFWLKDSLKLARLNREAHNSGPALYSCPLPSIEPLVIIW